MALAVGAPAPDFSLRNQHGETVTLASFAGGKDAVLVFFPFAFSSVCTGELHELRDRFGELADEHTEILAISCDHRYSQRAYADRDGYPFSLLSDFWPHGEVARAYQVFDDEVGCAGRSTFVIDRQGLVRWRVDHDVAEARKLDDYIAVLAELRRAKLSGAERPRTGSRSVADRII